MDTPRTNQVRTNATVQPLSAFSKQSVKAVSEALNGLLADAFTLYVKTKNFHWHVSGPHFRDYHLMFDEQAEQILATTDALAERVRKIGAATLHSIGEIARLRRIRESEEESVPASRMLSELAADNEEFAATLRAAHRVCDDAGDVASTSLIENWVDEAEKRIWFLRETAG
jgi:starvation-inducible DNA-binding protein